MKHLTAPRMDQCIGCQSCSLACARIVFKKISWNCTGIRIYSSGGLTSGFAADRCLACSPAPCAAVCPSGAFSNRRSGGVIFKKALCIQCGSCAVACPVGAVYRDLEGNVYVCIHCGVCVDFCPQNCLEMQDASAGLEVKS
jgi:Fe-S-cluster-containing dehydrogenase component